MWRVGGWVGGGGSWWESWGGNNKTNCFLTFNAQLTTKAKIKGKNQIHFTITHHYRLEEDLEKLEFKELGWQKLESAYSWQMVKNARIFSNLFQLLRKITFDSSAFCSRGWGVGLNF